MESVPTSERQPSPLSNIRFRRRDAAFFLIAASVVVLDQITKAVVRANLDYGEAWPDRDWVLNIINVSNSGAAFGILKGQTIFLVGTSLVGLAAILSRGQPDRPRADRRGDGLRELHALPRVQRRRLGDQHWGGDAARIPAVQRRGMVPARFRRSGVSGPESEPKPQIHRRTADASGERLDVFLARSLPDLTRSRARRLIDDGLVTIDRRQATKAGVTLERGQRIEVTVPPPERTDIEPQAIPLRIVYEDDDLLVVDKATGIAVHPSAGHASHTLVNAVLAHCPDLSGIGGEGRPGIVHRLDKDTSGLIIVAKNDAAHLSLARQLKERRVAKTYIALVEGRVEPGEGVIDAPLARHPVHRKKQAVVANGREARTRYRVVRQLDPPKARLQPGGATTYTLVEARPETGRTHQIRAHFASIGHPIAGDALYGHAGPAPLQRQFLHASKLAFAHPRTGERIELEAPLAEDLAEVLEALER
jgi:23S rRNA pseudouridine1911/1915/1917 synthase